jgi:osmotically-inducible protein OsmY
MTERYEDRYRHDPYQGHRRYGREDRGFMDRAGDEVRTWFGDEEAERRRRFDEQERQRERQREDNYGREYNWRTGVSGRDWEGRSQGYSRGPGFADRNEPSYPSSAYGSSYGSGAGGAFCGSTMRNEFGNGGRSGDDRHAGGSGEYGSQRNRQFAGKGPKGYTRPDARITEDVCDRLADSWDVDASEIEVRVSNGEVTLSGCVNDRHQKRCAEDLVENLSGVREVNNQLRVTRGDGSTTTSGSTTPESSSKSVPGNPMGTQTA